MSDVIEVGLSSPDVVINVTTPTLDMDVSPGAGIVQLDVQATPVDLELNANQIVLEVAMGGAPGPPGPPGASGTASAEGAQPVALDVWMMTHNLHFHPAGWSFANDSGDPMVPVRIVDITIDVATAVWLTPVTGTWKAS